MKINVGVVGFGNLGKALVQNLKNNEIFNLVAVFSKRKLINTLHYSRIFEYKDKIDLLFLCVGSQNSLEKVSSELIPHFSLIECYDNHEKLSKHVEKMDFHAKINNKIALCSFGWDPGLFSLMRGLFTSLGFQNSTFWGKGVSQGHSNAIKQIKGVIDAIQFTIPNHKTIKKVKRGNSIQSQQLHRRKCYVVCDKKDKTKIKKSIINMPNYFKGFKTKVKFVKQTKLNKLKTLSHKGTVITENNTINFSLTLTSNPDFTAKVLIAFAKSYQTLRNKKNYGAYTIFDLPLTYIIDNKYNYL